MNERPGRADLAAVAGYLLLGSLFFWPILATNAILAGYDTVTIFYPHRALVAGALLGGRLPLWNPFHFLGAPLLANPQVAAFYPLNWPFFTLAPGPSLAYTMVLHIVLAAVFMYLFARLEMGLRRPGAWLAGLCFAFGGFVGQQTGHLNQVSVAAWLPLVLLLGARLWRRPSAPRAAACALVIGLQMLAGHTQESYMILAALGLYAAHLSVSTYGVRRLLPMRRVAARPAITPAGAAGDPPAGRPWLQLGALAGAAALGMALAAVQILPTLELSRLSIRSGGLSFRQASSFSLNPLDLPLSLLPNVSAAAPNEMAGYIGTAALLLAVVGAFLSPRRREARFMVILAGVALLLALGRYTPVYWAAYYGLPGINLFRVPARWLFIYSFAVAMLAGLGFDALRNVPQALGNVRLARRLLAGCVAAAVMTAFGVLLIKMHLPAAQAILVWASSAGSLLALIALDAPRRRPALFVTLCITLTCGELYAAGRYLEYNRYVAPESLSALRPAIAYIQSQPDGNAASSRVLSVSDATWDPGDLADVQAILSGASRERAAGYLDSIKNKELLTANLPELFGIASADGYDGGVLPLSSYVNMERLFLPDSELSPDGRLRDHLRAIPEARLLSLLNVGYIITDKNRDVWLDNVYYDMAFSSAVTTSMTLTVAQPIVATAIGLITRVDGGAPLGDGMPVASIDLVDEAGGVSPISVLAGRDTAQQGQATQAKRVDTASAGAYYYAVLPAAPRVPVRMIVRSLLPDGVLSVRALALIDQRTGASISLPASPDVELVHSGDVKVYRNLRNLPRGYVVHRARVIGDTEDAVAIMREPAFDPAQEAVVQGALAEELWAPGRPDQVTISAYKAEHVVLDADLGGAGVLVVADTYYPGWLARVDGVRTEMLRVNGMFRGIALPAGAHHVELIYRPLSLRAGALLTLPALAITLGLFAAGRRRRSADTLSAT